MHLLGRAYHARGVAMQLHLGAIRNQNPRIYEAIGPDAGGDSVGLTTDPFQLGALLGDLARENSLPKTVLYNLNPADNAVFSTMAVSFAPNIQFGAAWWFNDTLRGMRRQLSELMENGLLANSIGMLTDSRSFSSFPRHEYYRRILCQKLGELVEDGQYPVDEKDARKNRREGLRGKRQSVLRLLKDRRKKLARCSGFIKTAPDMASHIGSSFCVFRSLCRGGMFRNAPHRPGGMHPLYGDPMRIRRCPWGDVGITLRTLRMDVRMFQKHHSSRPT